MSDQFVEMFAAVFGLSDEREEVERLRAGLDVIGRNKRLNSRQITLLDVISIRAERLYSKLVEEWSGRVVAEKQYEDLLARHEELLALIRELPGVEVEEVSTVDEQPGRQCEVE